MKSVNVELLWLGARCAAIRIADGGLFHTVQRYGLRVNGVPADNTDKVVTLLHRLMPATAYTVELTSEQDLVLAELHFETPQEYVTLNARAFGAKGDGETDDTAAVQAAILCCPANSRVLIPAGAYPVTHLFLKSGLRLEIAKGAYLLGIPDRTRIPILPGMTETTDEADEYNLGTWEGNPLSMYASLLTGVDVEDVVVYGEGVLDGRAGIDNWWQNPKQKQGAWRPRMIFLERCENVTIAGLTIRNSPAWNVHPYFSRDVRLLGLTIQSPADSPNTDGINPESCDSVTIAGVDFSVGDDCIAIKSGKRYMGDTYAVPCKHVHVSHCCMGDGHGAVTIGSEMSGGVHDVLVEHCAFHNTDRGLRVKTRRGRGKHAIVDSIVFRDIQMRRVKTPFTVNCFYRCDPDGDAPDVQDRNPMPLREDTPQVKRLHFERIAAEDCQVAAGYFLGLPERPIGEISMRDVDIRFVEDAVPGEPIMTQGIEPVAKQGIIAINVDTLTLHNVSIDGKQVTEGGDEA